MKIKDLLDFNPEAEIKVGFANGAKWSHPLQFKLHSSTICVFKQYFTSILISPS